MKKLPLVVTTVLVLALGIISCSQEQPPVYTPPTPAIAVDRPSLYPSEAIRIARQHALTSPVSLGEKHAATWIRKLEAEGWGIGDIVGFDASYQGNGKWQVILRALSEEGQPLNEWFYYWAVFEKTLSAVFLKEWSVYP